MEPNGGDVAGSVEASAALAQQARATRARMHQAQSDGKIPWLNHTTDRTHLKSKKLEESTMYADSSSCVQNEELAHARIFVTDKVETDRELIVSGYKEALTKFNKKRN